MTWFQKISFDTSVDTSVVEKFYDLADSQRGAPESAMLNTQRAIGGGLMNATIEHVGDLIHRMCERPTFHNGGYNYVKPKVDRALIWLTQEYGFGREFIENLVNNARSKGIPEEQYKRQAFDALRQYADAHRQLRPFNEVQRLANDAAIALGMTQFQQATLFLRRLQDYLNRGIEFWTAKAHEIK